ncbi:hypothetical protein F2Q70_00018019 [Brassica cretica]|uniref:Uncharacterized protein n=1 Tax=Brassica cretica TaxID=69181 RepID=A0A8S9HZB3_BRACR|nr:hypothetical protein F2Q70_00018019 [Brassica cretica]
MSPDDTPADGNRPSASVTPAPDAQVAPNQSVPEMLQAIMARFIQQEETNKATSDRLAALAAALGTLDGENDRAETARRSTPSAMANPEDDLRQSLNQKLGKTIESFTPTDISTRTIGSSGTLMEIDGAPPRISHSIRKLNVSDARHVIDAKRKDPLHRQDELAREQLSNSQPDYRPFRNGARADRPVSTQDSRPAYASQFT